MGASQLGVGSAVVRARDGVRTSLWPLPTAAVFVAVALGVALPRVDAALADTLPSWLSGYLFGGGASAARTLLDAIASSLVTVTSLTFSLTVVTLQLASSQFSPRLLRTFTRDLFVQGTLALFLATFTYALTVLRSVRSADEGGAVFVPQISVTVAFILALASVVGLVLFLAHLTREIRVERMVRNVHAEASRTATRLLASMAQTDAGAEVAVPEAPGNARVLLAGSSGFVLGVDHGQLVEAAERNDAVVVVARQVGTPIVFGTPIGRIWSTSPGHALSESEAQRLHDAVRDAVKTGFERTPADDIALGLRQLTDVANKALSPGINDPTTAIHALTHSAAFLSGLDPALLRPRVLCHSDGQVRLVLAFPALADLLELAIDEPRRYGCANPQVLLALFELLRNVAWRLGASEPDVIRAQLARTVKAATAQDFDAAVLARLDDAADQATRALEGIA